MHPVHGADALPRLFAMKRRPLSRNLPIMVASPDQADELGADVTAPAKRLLAAFSPGPLTLALGLDQQAAPDWLAGRDEIAVRIPDDPLLLEVLRAVGPLLVTSANLHAQETPESMRQVLDQLDGEPDLALDGGVRGDRPVHAGELQPAEPGGRAGRRRPRRPDREGAGMTRAASGGRSGPAWCSGSRPRATTPRSRWSTGPARSSPRRPRPRSRCTTGTAGSTRRWRTRAHVDKILPTVRMVLDDSGVDPRSLRAIGVTRGPGLIGSLMVGVSTAAGLGQGWGVPVLGINHLRGHLRSADLEERRVDYPAIILLVSGGHTFLARMTDPGTITLLGSTVDDSVGEAYDKVARMLGLGYPGARWWTSWRRPARRSSRSRGRCLPTG